MPKKRSFQLLLVIATLALLQIACGSARRQVTEQDPGQLNEDSAGSVQLPDAKPLWDGARGEMPATGNAALRILFIVDTSHSMAITDPLQAGSCFADCDAESDPDGCRAQCAERATNGKLRAIESYLRKRPEADLEVAIITFGSRVDTALAFSGPVTQLADRVHHLKQSAGLTDYQGALTRAQRLVAAQLVAEGGTNTRYELVFITDGQPSPECAMGCNNDATGNTPSWCDIPRDQWQSQLGLLGALDPDRWFPALEPCKDYNRAEKLQGMVAGLVEQIGQGGATGHFHTLLLTAPQAPPFLPTVSFGSQKITLPTFLEQLAQVGGGSFRQVGASLLNSMLDHLD